MAEWENMLTVAKLTHQTSSSGNNNMQPNDITFFQRFQDDILAGRKTITIRDESTIEVTGTSTVTLDTLTEKHAQQENMTLGELKRVIAEIYPNQRQFYVIDFKCV